MKKRTPIFTLLLLMGILGWGQEIPYGGHSVPYTGTPIQITYEGWSGMFISTYDYLKIKAILAREANLDEREAIIQENLPIVLEENEQLHADNEILKGIVQKRTTWVIGLGVALFSLLLGELF